MRGHVLVDRLLQIEPLFAQRAGHDIRANAGIQRHVSAGIRDGAIFGIVTHRDADLSTCRSDRSERFEANG